jgi:hypothetical protein
MPLGAINPGLRDTFTFHITANTTVANLRTLANTAGYAGQNDVYAYLDVGIEARGATFSNTGLVAGSWPANSRVRFVNNGTISGAGGGGGGGGNAAGPCSTNGGPGGNGGTAFSASGISGYHLIFINNGTVRGGGGGGGGGAAGWSSSCSCGVPTFFNASGGNGGNGQGPSAAGGGSAGGSTLCGALNGGTGGNGGNYGTAGAGGGASTPCFGGTLPGAGGAAGHSVTGTSLMTYTNNGTQTGPTSGT